MARAHPPAILLSMSSLLWPILRVRWVYAGQIVRVWHTADLLWYLSACAVGPYGSELVLSVFCLCVTVSSLHGVLSPLFVSWGPLR